ncbi:Mut7-C RNAse domain-containing protein, partial [Ralstonia pseudosolanacearum]
RLLSAEEAAASVPPRVRERQHLFSTCDVCRRVYWPGSHWARMNTSLARMLAPHPDGEAEADAVQGPLRHGGVRL